MEAIDVAGPTGRLTGWTAHGSDPSSIPLLLIHPINMQGRIWPQMIEHMSPERTYLMPDLRAHGGSDRDGEFGLDEWTDDCEAVLDACDIQGPVHVAGGSLGGSLACVLASRRRQQVTSIAAMGSSLRFEVLDVASVLDQFDELGVEGTFRKVFPELTFAPGCDPEIVEQGVRLANPNDVETVKRVWFATISSDSRELAASLDIPAMVVTGAHDATCTPALGLEMAEILGTEQIVMPGIGHMPMLERPERAGHLLEQHLRVVESGLVDRN